MFDIFNATSFYDTNGKLRNIKKKMIVFEDIDIQDEDLIKNRKLYKKDEENNEEDDKKR